MTLNPPQTVLNQVLITPGALAVLDPFAGDKQTYLAVTRAIEGAAHGSLSVALIITAGQAWKSPSASLDQALIDVSTRFSVA